MPRTQVPEEGQRVQNINELKDLKPRPEAVIRTEGAASRNDGLSNLYWWDPNGVATNANGTTIISSNVSGYTSGDPNEGVWRRMFKPSSEIESQIEKSAGNQGAVQYSDGSGGFLGNANYLYVDDSNATVGIGTSSPNTSVALEIAGNTEISNNTIIGNGGNLSLVEPFLNAFGGGKYGFNSNGDPVISDASNDTRYVANDNGATVLTNGNVQVANSLSVGQTSSPGFTLDVNGDANISSNLDVGGDATISGALNVQDFTFDQSSEDLVLSDNNGVELIRQPKAGPTQFIQGAEIGSIEAPTDSFTQVINAPSTSAAASGDLVGYTFAVDNQSILEVKADADGSGGITNKRVDFPGDLEFGGAGDGLVSSGGNLNVRLPINDGATFVTNAYEFVFGNQLDVNDDGGNQVTVSVDESTLDADTLDGVDGSNYARTDIAETFNDQVYFTGGNVGIGTNSPSRNLEVNGDVFINNGANGQLSIKTDDGTSKEFDINTQTGGNYGNADAHPTTNRLLFSGNSSGGVSETGSILWSGGGTGGAPNSSLYFSSTTRLQRNTDGTNNFGQADVKIDTGGNVGIATNSPNYKLDVNGDINAQGNLRSSGNVVSPDSNDDAHHPDHRDGINHITFNDQEGGNFTSDGDLLFDRSEGLFIYQDDIQPGNVHGGSDAYLVLSAANISEGDGINISGGKGQDSGPVRFDARLPVKDGGSGVTSAYSFNFGNQLEVFDDGSNQVSVAVDESGLDADSVDGYEGSEIAIRAEDEIITGQWSFPNGGTIAKGAISWDGSGRIDYRYGKSEYPTAPRANGALQDRVVFNGGTVYYAAYEPGTEIYIRDSSGNTRDAIGTTTSATRGSFSASSGEVIRTNKPVELLDSNRRPLPAVTMTGMQFYTGVSRNSPENLKFYAPKEDAEVTIELGSDGSTQSLQVPADRSTHQVSISHGGSEDFYVTSTSPVLFVSEGSGGDRKIVYPMAYEVMGDQLNDVQTINGNGPQESQTNYYRNDDEKLSGWGTGDGSGGDAETTIPVDMLGNRYIYGNASDYQITTIFPTVVEVYDEFGNQVQSHDLTGASRKNPQTASVGSDSGDATDNIGNGPLLFKSEAPFLIRGNATNNDEYTFYGWRDDLREKSNSQVWGDSIVEGSIDPENVSDKFAIVDENETITGTWTYDSNGQQLEFDHDGNRRLIDINRNGTGEWSLSASGPDIHFDDVNGGPEDVLYLESGGNVGIQTDSPSSALDVNGDIYVNKTIARSSDSSQERLTFDKDGTLEMDRQLDFELNTDGSRSAGSVRWAFIAAGNEKMRIEESGNVGIGTSSPEVTGLHIEKGQAGSDPGLLRIQSSSAGSTEKGDTYAGIELGVDGGNTGASGEQAVTAYIKAKDDRGGLTSYEDGGLSFGTMDAGESYPQEQMFIDAAGKVGIGTNSPSYDLEVSGTSSMNRLNLKNEESANSDGDIIRDNSVGFIGKWGSNTQAVFWDSNNVSTGSNLTVNGGLGQESQPNISIVNNPQFSGGQIGLGNDPDVINYEDSNNASGPYWNNKDKLEIRGDGSVSGIELEAGYMHATQAAHVSGPIKVDDEVNFSGSFNVEYNSNSESLDFIYTG